MERADVLIAGGGIIGTAIAWALARRGVGGIAVVDLDLSGMYASSELNAGGARATWWQPVNIATCAATLDFFRQHRAEFGFREHGYLWLYDDAALFARARRTLALQNSYGLGVTALDPADVAARFPIIDRGLDELVGATFSPRDGLVNPNAVRAWFRREAATLGVRFLDHHYVDALATRLVSTPEGARTPGGSRMIESVDVAAVRVGDARESGAVLGEILTTHRIPAERRLGDLRIGCGVLINCLGAWSSLLSAKLGIADLTQPVRRQISLCDVRRHDRPESLDIASLGMIVDASNVYFHPEGAQFLAGFSIPDEPPGTTSATTARRSSSASSGPACAPLRAVRTLPPRRRLGRPLRRHPGPQRHCRRRRRLRQSVRGALVHRPRRDAVVRRRRRHGRESDRHRPLRAPRSDTARPRALCRSRPLDQGGSAHLSSA
jgi:glycine/D-amino acid oxidase-like deaminating enzyme